MVHLTAATRATYRGLLDVRLRSPPTTRNTNKVLLANAAVCGACFFGHHTEGERRGWDVKGGVHGAKDVATLCGGERGLVWVR